MGESIKTISLILLLFLMGFGVGCSSTSQISSDVTGTFYTYQTFSDAMKSENIDAVLNDGTIIRVTNFVARPDSLRWIRVEDGKPQSVATSDLTRVEITNRLGGAFEGAFIGGASGVAVIMLPYLIYKLEGKTGGDWSGYPSPMLGAIGGGLLGVGIGAAIGHTSKYQFVPDSAQFKKE